ncbi:guanylate kinase [Ectothiorhodospira shaposhnikovii]|uniref:guanylate kinase n=1 Tax=Ectothiorhodospira shaposhnikovii TaxID=1054 RepID=UPI001EE8187C|nr:guanylate kinase [Ectothiorhodospira shaposhnikovii]MCG5512883.1 guanylate kinase [Ectothiorhodospira shaposhnikovii]
MSNLLLTITGPTASGKTTLQRILCELGFERLITCTTRSPRPGEVPGREYFFVDRQLFLEMIAAGEMAEYVERGGELYGLPVSQLLRASQSDAPCVVVVDPRGALKVAQKARERPLSVFALFMSGSKRFLLERYLKRELGTGSPDLSEMAERIVCLLDEEMSWESAMDWSAMASDFGPENQVEVVHFLVDYACRRMGRKDWLKTQEAAA